MEQFTPDQLIVTTLVIIVASFVIYQTYTGVKSAIKNNKDAGVVFGSGMLSQKGLIVKMGIGLFLILEAAMTSIYHNAVGMNEVYAASYNVPVGVRFGAHFLIAFYSFVLTYATPQKWIHLLNIVPFGALNPFSTKARKVAIAKHKKSKVNGQDMILALISAVFNSAVALALPLLNIYMLALASQQTVHVMIMASRGLNIVTLGLLGLSTEAMATIDFSVLGPVTQAAPHIMTVNGVDTQVLGPEYNVFADMLYPIQFIVVTSVLHYVLTLNQSFDTFSKDRQAGNTGGSSKVLKSKDKDDKLKKEDIYVDLENDPATSIEEVISFYGYEGDKLDEKVSNVVDNIVKMEDQHLSQLSSKLVEFIFEIRGLDDKKSSKATTVRREIHAFFSRPYKNGKGFGIFLSKKTGGIE